MRLIRTATIELQEFINSDEIPPYAILSHTWGKDEITFQDMRLRSNDPDITSTQSYEKVVQCCRMASQNGLEWAWIDTCCIDKTSSAELSEAINSMYRWYQEAVVCYVFLYDLTLKGYQDGQLSDCRWFTRGWTLQEMIAPKDAVFFSASWERLATKVELVQELATITGVAAPFLLGQKDVAQASIAMRMSWAASRDTSRPEDIAYSLLGLFDINLPLIYGEGKKAFRRLQEELIRTQPYEHTIYAWGDFSIYDDGPLPYQFAGLEELGVHPTALPVRTILTWDEDSAKTPLLGLLAESPTDFKGCGNFQPLATARGKIMKKSASTWSLPVPLPVFLHEGIRARFHTVFLGHGSIAHHLEWPPIIQLRTSVHICLLAEDVSVEYLNQVVIPLVSWHDWAYGRKRQAMVYTGTSQPQPETEFFITSTNRRESWSREWRDGDIIFRWDMDRNTVGIAPENFVWNKDYWCQMQGDQAFVRDGPFSTLNSMGHTNWVASWIFKIDSDETFWYIVLHRAPSGSRRMGTLAISIVRCLRPGSLDGKRLKGYYWHPPSLLEDCSLESVQQLACCSHVTREEVDIWRPEAEGLPRGIVFCVETIWNADRSVSVDVVDFRYPDVGEGEEYFYVPRAR